MKRFSTAGLLIVTLAICAAVLVWYWPNTVGDESPTRAGTASSAPSGSGSPATGTSNPPVTAAIPKPATATLSHVAFVHDGDTLYLQPDGTTSRADEITVRLIGLDTPELRPSVECFAIEARDHVRALLPKGTAVWIATDVQKRDQYGRSLLYLWTKDGRSINLDLVQKGYATALNIAPSNKYRKQFDLAEAAARRANAGLWGHC
ncbi:MAG: thermonuclease family protein [Cryobacterium sp.]|nr:thermonuclease family protein [Cryobacterium sp.]